MRPMSERVVRSLVSLSGREVTAVGATICFADGRVCMPPRDLDAADRSGTHRGRMALRIPMDLVRLRDRPARSELLVVALLAALGASVAVGLSLTQRPTRSCSIQGRSRGARRARWRRQVRALPRVGKARRTEALFRVPRSPRPPGRRRAWPAWNGIQRRDCGTCHVEHVGRGAPLVRWPGGRESFDHRMARWPLEGGHAGVACDRCHDARTSTEGTKLPRRGHRVPQLSPGPARRPARNRVRGLPHPSEAGVGSRSLRSTTATRAFHCAARTAASTARAATGHPRATAASLSPRARTATKIRTGAASTSRARAATPRAAGTS